MTTAASAEEAARLLSEVWPHILVTDIAMPDDGLSLIREVRAIAKTKNIHVPVIAITAHPFRRAELLAEGFVELVEKPLDPIARCGLTAWTQTIHGGGEGMVAKDEESPYVPGRTLPWLDVKRTHYENLSLRSMINGQTD